MDYWWRDFNAGKALFEVLDKNISGEMIVFDTETTGLKPTEDRIIQIAAIKMKIEENRTLTETDRLNLYINPGYKLPKKIVEITGITDELLSDKPSEDIAFKTINDFFGNSHMILCGHNVTFDISFMNEMYMRQCNSVIDADKLDTLRMAQELYRKQEGRLESAKKLKNHKLGTLVEEFGLDYGLTFHNAMDDVIATTRLLRFFIEEYQERKTKANENKALEDESEQPKKIKTKILSCWSWQGFRGLRRVYVRVLHENRVIWINQNRPHEWGEKDKYSLELFDIADLESQLIKMCKLNELDDISKFSGSVYNKFYS